MQIVMKETQWPLCRERIKITSRPWRGQQIECPACDAVLEVIGLKPFSLDWPYDDLGYIGFDFDEEEVEFDKY
jgi:hypothetical protein